MKPGRKVDLADFDPDSTAGAPGKRAETEAALPELQQELADLQDRLWAEAKRSLLVVLQAMDAGGKDGTIKHVFRGVNPQGTPGDVVQGADASRAGARLPVARAPGRSARGRDRRSSTARTTKTCSSRACTASFPKPVWRERYDLINSFEALLASRRHHGDQAVPAHLEGRAAQALRLAAATSRRSGGSSSRRISPSASTGTSIRWPTPRRSPRPSTADAPWYVIPADHKWCRNWAVSSILVDTLRRMDPQYPEPQI